MNVHKLVTLFLFSFVMALIVFTGTEQTQAQKGPPPVLEDWIFIDYETLNDAPESSVRFKNGGTHYFFDIYVDWSTMDTNNINRLMMCEYYDTVEERWVALRAQPQDGVVIGIPENSTGQNQLWSTTLIGSDPFAQTLTVTEILYVRARLLDWFSSTLTTHYQWIEVTWIP